MIHKKHKIFYHKTKKKIISNYAHHHPLLFFALVFNVFIFIVLFFVYQINNDTNLMNAGRALFNQPNPTILADAEDVMVGYPMVEMAPYIARENREVAAFLVAIAKKESGWGTHTPKLNGEECYNYWGFRQKRERMGSGGHTCFDTPEEAVTVVSLRIKDLIRKGYDTPEKIVVWKCGSCNGPARVGSAKWVQDVDMYYQQMIN
ncbi:MAG: hypothetical protein U9Q12_02850 [Patescibacteria group bacterium]|nr:hypothetical protein [Patescibacteria group bacterium]